MALDVDIFFKAFNVYYRYSSTILFLSAKLFALVYVGCNVHTSLSNVIFRVIELSLCNKYILAVDQLSLLV